MGNTLSKMLKRVDFGPVFNQICSFDPGSSNVVLATPTTPGILREPCLVALAPRRGRGGKRGRERGSFRVQAVGSEAVGTVPGSGHGMRLIYPIDHGHIADPETLEPVLRKLIDQAPFNPLRKALFGVRLTLLAALHLAESDRLRYVDLLRDFGFNRIHPVPTPVAAARGSGLDTSQSRGQMLIDMGGGQTTITAFTMGSIAAWHWCPVGGRDLDEAIRARVEEHHHLSLSPAAAETVKLTLGSVYPRARPEVMDIVGVDLVSDVEKKVTLDDNELRDALVDACEPLVMAIHQSFDGVPPELAADIAQGEIVLVGGAALLAGLPEFLAERTGLRFRVADDPINAAIRGALAEPIARSDRAE